MHPKHPVAVTHLGAGRAGWPGPTRRVACGLLCGAALLSGCATGPLAPPVTTTETETPAASATAKAPAASATMAPAAAGIIVHPSPNHTEEEVRTAITNAATTAGVGIAQIRPAALGALVVDFNPTVTQEQIHQLSKDIAHHQAVEDVEPNSPMTALNQPPEPNLGSGISAG